MIFMTFLGVLANVIFDIMFYFESCNWLLSFLGKQKKAKQLHRMQNRINRITMQYIKNHVDNNYKAFVHFYSLHIIYIILILPTYLVTIVIGFILGTKAIVAWLCFLLIAKEALVLIAFGQFGSAPTNGYGKTRKRK